MKEEEWRDGARKLSKKKKGMSEVMDVEMKVLPCHCQSLHRRMEQYNENLFTSNTLLGFGSGDLSPV